tara:strand:+ start:1660 stop:2808 length:1149 start_codon:yes stop_codon:yes gene_type:complete
MQLSNTFKDLVLKQLESFGISMGVKHMMVYLATATNGIKAGFELIGQWPQLDKSLMPIDDDPELKVSSPNRRWYPLQDKDILIGVLRVETDFKNGEWPLELDSRLKALSISLAKSFAIEIDRQSSDEEKNYLRSQISIIIHQLRNPLAALRTYAKLLMRRLDSDNDSLEILESMMREQKQINEYVSSFEKLNQPKSIPLEFGEERLLLLPNLDISKKVTIQILLAPLLERGKANAKLQNKNWIQSSEWPDWTLQKISPSYAVIAEIVANLLENAFKYSKMHADIGIKFNTSGLLIFDNGKKITNDEKEKIFQKGFRGAASRNKDGSGVGLYLAKKLAISIGGDLVLLDENIGDNFDINSLDIKKTNIFYLKIPTEQLHKKIT